MRKDKNWQAQAGSTCICLSSPIDDFFSHLLLTFLSTLQRFGVLLLLFLVISLVHDLEWPPQLQNLKYIPSLAFTTAAKFLQLSFQILLDQNFCKPNHMYFQILENVSKPYPTIYLCIWGEMEYRCKKIVPVEIFHDG